MPGRKRLALYVHESGPRHGVVRALAYFRDEADARECMAILDALVKL